MQTFQPLSGTFQLTNYFYVFSVLQSSSRRVVTSDGSIVKRGVKLLSELHHKIWIVTYFNRKV